MWAPTPEQVFQVGGLALLVLGVAVGGNAVVDPACVDGHYLTVSAYESGTPPAEDVVAHENLTETQQALFEEALAEGSVRVDRSQLGPLTDAIVAYRGDHYRAIVAHGDCGNRRELHVGGGVAAVLLGGALFANGRGWTER